MKSTIYKSKKPSHKVDSDFISKKSIDVYLMIGSLNGESLCHFNSSHDLSTYSHATKIIKFYVQNGFIIIEKKGRNNKYFYTDKGKKLHDLFLALRLNLISEGLWRDKRGAKW